MKKYTLLVFALALTTLTLTLFSCAKEVEPIAPPVEETNPDIPDGSRIFIHFGTSTQFGCMYSFSNCIWIGWGAEATNFHDRLALQFDEGDEAARYFGYYFPLTQDYVVDAATAKTLGIPEQVIPAGFYSLRDAASGQATGKRLVSFDSESALRVGNLVNPANPQDNIGQLHNLAVQVVLNENRDALEALQQDKKGLQKFLTEKVTAFLAEAGLPVDAAGLQRAQALNLDRDYSNYAARLNETRLSANDKKALLDVFKEAAGIPVSSPEELGHFVNILTERENHLAGYTKLDNPKVVLSMISVLKYSRYFWYWKSISPPIRAAALNRPAFQTGFGPISLGWNWAAR
ncbi:MAG: hypothetical protein IPH12_10665 [Saprospirales bacterium]|nr:hypothetical protein [Saprospirales bacterium]